MRGVLNESGDGGVFTVTWLTKKLRVGIASISPPHGIVKGVDYGVTVGVSLKNSGIEWFDLVLVACACALGLVIHRVLIPRIRYSFRNRVCRNH